MFAKRFWIIIAASLLISSHVSAEADIEAGKAFSANCVPCHGTAGISPGAEVPNLAGQIPEYMVMRVNEFRNAKQGDSLMHGLAKLLNNPQDIKNVAAYYGSLPRANYSVRNKSLVERGEKVYFSSRNCYMCHGRDAMGLLGSSESVPSPMIIGQTKDYLLKELHAFRTNKRVSKGGYMMNLILPFMTEEDIDAVAEYLSSQ